VLLRDGYYRDDDSKWPIGRPACDLVQSVDPATEGSFCNAEDHQPCKLRALVRDGVAERGETMERDATHVAAWKNPTEFEKSIPSGIVRFAPRRGRSELLTEPFETRTMTRVSYR
jgi:hypothetical protein